MGIGKLVRGVADVTRGRPGSAISLRKLTGPSLLGLRLGDRGRRRLAGPLVVAVALLLLVFPAFSVGGQAAQASTTAPTMSNCPTGMSKVTDGQFRVFACDDGPSAAADEQTALTDLGFLFGPETDLMGPPLPDNQVTGENGRIDVYLVASGQTLTREGDTVNLQTDRGCPCLGQAPWDAINGTVSSGYIVALRPEALAAGESFNSVLAHEFFHVLQFSHNTTKSCRKFWFLEASATWAEWQFAPGTAGTMVYPDISAFQAKPGVSLTDSVNRPPYADWMWPLFMQQQAGEASIGNAWKAMEGKTGCDALNAAINAQVPFSTHFGDFAVENFDSELANTATQVPAWPVNFGTDYPDWVAASNASAPAFPQIMPTQVPDNGVTLSKHPYPYIAQIPVNLPPLSAQYTHVSLVPPPATVVIGQGGSVEFDFSGLASSGVGVTLLAADSQKSGYAKNNGVWQRIDLTGGDTQAKVCFNADGTKKSMPLTGQFYVILTNATSGPSATPITGSYMVTQRTTCASEATGSLTLKTTVNSGTGIITKQSATLNLHYISASFLAGAYDWAYVPSANTWSEQYKQSFGCSGGRTETVSASGSGTMIGNDGIGALDAWEQSYSFTPSLPGVLLGGEKVQGTESGCANGPVTVGMAIGQGCPIGSIYAPFKGIYTVGDVGVDFTCSGSSKFYTVNISGTLTATDPIQCGLWTQNCSIGSSPPARQGTRTDGRNQVSNGLERLRPWPSFR
jgi:hypothetical protein